MRGLRSPLPVSLSNGSIMRKAHICATGVKHAHMAGVSSQAELATELRHNDAPRLGLRPRTHLAPLARRNRAG